MSPRRRVRLSALVIVALIVAVPAAPASAQFYEAALRSLDLSPDPLARSPRLVGMGRLTYVGNDPHNRIRMWDFAGNPTGIAEAESTSTFELRPMTGSASGVRDLRDGASLLERQDLAARATRFGFEGWRRTSGSTAYGVVGDVASLRYDRLYGDDSERRSQFSLPRAMPVLTGRLPYASGRWSYALRLSYSGENTSDKYLSLVRNGAGEYLGRDGMEMNPPDFFRPTDYDVRSVGAGLAVSAYVNRWLTAAVGVDRYGNDIAGTNEDPRHASEISEKRPYGAGQATLIGRIGREIEWGVDGRGWRSSSEQRWAFSISAGIGQDPLVGRGKLLEREETGSALRSRVRWVRGPLELGAGFNTGFRRVTITPPAAGDPTSFNAFRNRVFYRSNTDSLALSDSVIYNRSEERSWEAGGGLAWRLFGGRGTWGAEFHRRHDVLDQVVGGHGPVRSGWDVRTGLEVACTPVLTGRVGYLHRWDDRDLLTRQNEFLGNGLTLGLGVGPAGSAWSLESGYLIEWQQADYGDPDRPRSSRQQLAAQLRWTF